MSQWVSLRIKYWQLKQYVSQNRLDTTKNHEFYVNKKTVLQSQESLLGNFPWDKVLCLHEHYPTKIGIVIKKLSDFYNKNDSKTPNGGPIEKLKMSRGIFIFIICHHNIEDRIYRKNVKNDFKISQITLSNHREPSLGYLMSRNHQGASRTYQTSFMYSFTKLKLVLK